MNDFPPKLGILIFIVITGEQVVLRAPGFHQRGLGSIPASSPHIWLEFVASLIYIWEGTLVPSHQNPKFDLISCDLVRSAFPLISRANAPY